jgi:hypothetical protein
MRPDAGFTDIPTAGTRVKWSASGAPSSTDRFVWAQFQGVIGNTGAVYVGIGDVKGTATIHGWELNPPVAGRPTVPLTLDPGKYAEPGQKTPTMKVDDIQFDAATNGDDVSWIVILAE